MASSGPNKHRQVHKALSSLSGSALAGLVVNFLQSVSTSGWAAAAAGLSPVTAGAVLATAAIFGISQACEGKAERKKAADLAKEFEKLQKQEGQALDLLNKIADQEIGVTLDWFTQEELAERTAAMVSGNMDELLANVLESQQVGFATLTTRLAKLCEKLDQTASEHVSASGTGATAIGGNLVIEKADTVIIGSPGVTATQAGAANSTRSLLIVVDGDFGAFGEAETRILQFGLASFLNLKPSAVRVVCVEPGSIKVTLEIPAESVPLLFEGFRKGTLADFVKPLVIAGVLEVTTASTHLSETSGGDAMPPQAGTFEYDVFLSHNSADKPRVRDIAEKLRDEGLKVWFDEWIIRPGDDITLAIEDGLQASRKLILFMSKAAFDSEWVARERSAAVFGDPEDKDRRLIPVLLEDCNTPDFIRPRKYVDMRESHPDTFDRLLAACRPESGWEELARMIGEPRVSIAHLPNTGPHLFGCDAMLNQLDDAWTDNQTNVFALVAGGGVGKSALVNHWLAAMGQDDYRGARRVYGHSFYSQGTSEGVGSADQFFHDALRWFGDPDPTKGTAWARGERLAELVRKERTLLILDGMEPLQFPSGPNAGRVTDPGLQALLRELAARNPGLCVVTTREHVADLDKFEGAGATQQALGDLPNEAGANLLVQLGVKGPMEEMEKASKEFGNHALTLTLLGSYLVKACDGDIRRRTEIRLVDADKMHGGHARKVMASYEKWFAEHGREAEVSILRVLGLFDRRPDRTEIAALLASPAIPGLTDSLQGISSEELQIHLANLGEVRLLMLGDPPSLERAEAHPLVREYFAAQVRNRLPEAWNEAKRRLDEAASEWGDADQPGGGDIAGPLTVYVDLDRFNEPQIASILEVLSDCYELLSGDRLVIDGQGLIEPAEVPVGVET